LSDRTGGLLLIVGSVVFLIGAAIGVPRVFMEADPGARLRMVEARLHTWQLAQPLYAAGPLVCAVGVGVLARAGEEWLLACAAAALFVGAAAWAWLVYLRGRYVRAFAYRRLPRWPFRLYVLLTVLGLVLLGAGLLGVPFPAWVGWLTIAAACAFLALYLATGDIPPFVFYLLLLVVGAVVA
jgi:hypothetical protein